MLLFTWHFPEQTKQPVTLTEFTCVGPPIREMQTEKWTVRARMLTKLIKTHSLCGWFYRRLVCTLHDITVLAVPVSSFCQRYRLAMIFTIWQAGLFWLILEEITGFVFPDDNTRTLHQGTRTESSSPNSCWNINPRGDGIRRKGLWRCHFSCNLWTTSFLESCFQFTVN